MIPTLEQLRKEVHLKVNDMRRIDVLISSDEFPDLWKQCTDDQKLAINNGVAWVDKAAIFKIVKALKAGELGMMNMVQLRALAKKRGLVAYMQMSKSTLLSELSKLEGLDYD